MATISSSGVPPPSFDCPHILHPPPTHKTATVDSGTTGTTWWHGAPGACIVLLVHTTDMFTSITDRKAFGATYQWAVLSTLPMDSDKSRHGLRASEVNQALGMPKEARTTVTLLLKSMAADGMVERYEYKIGQRQFITYKRLIPLRKRERIARFLGV